MDAGHFYNVRYYDNFRYDEDNCHGQCSIVTGFCTYNLIEYQANLINKIGLQRFDSLR